MWARPRTERRTAFIQPNNPAILIDWYNWEVIEGLRNERYALPPSRSFEDVEAWTFALGYPIGIPTYIPHYRVILPAAVRLSVVYPGQYAGYKDKKSEFENNIAQHSVEGRGFAFWRADRFVPDIWSLVAMPCQTWERQVCELLCEIAGDTVRLQSSYASKTEGASGNVSWWERPLWRDRYLELLGGFLL